MRIFYLTGTDIGNPCSAQSVHVVELADAMARLGHAVYVYGVLGARSLRAGTAFHVRAVRPGRLVRTRLAMRFAVGLVAAQPDLLYFRFGFATVPLLALAKAFGVPCLVEVNGIPRYDAPSWHSAVVEVFEKFAYTVAYRILPVTPELLAYLQRSFHIPRSRLVVVPNGTNPSLYRPCPPDESVVRTEGRPTVGFLGYFVAHQGLDILIDAMPHVIREVPDALLLVGGDGPLRDALVRRTEDLGLTNHVRFVGRVDYGSSAGFVAACDVMVAPFGDTPRVRLTGLSPLKVYMYWACGKPVVLPDLPALKWAKRSGACIFAQPDIPEDFGRAITEALCLEPAAAEAMGRRGRNFTLRSYTWGRLAHRALEVGFGLRAGSRTIGP